MYLKPLTTAFLIFFLTLYASNDEIPEVSTLSSTIIEPGRYSLTYEPSKFWTTYEIDSDGVVRMVVNYDVQNVETSFSLEVVDNVNCPKSPCARFSFNRYSDEYISPSSEGIIVYRYVRGILESWAIGVRTILVFRQTFPYVWDKDSYRLYPNNPEQANFSILDELESFRSPNGRFYFDLEWPYPNSPTVSFRWSQISDPRTQATSGFVSFLEDTGYYHVKLGDIDTTNFRGLQPSESDETLMDGYFGTGDKFYPAVGFLGPNNIWIGIPCFYTTQIQLCPVVELYVRLFPECPSECQCIAGDSSDGGRQIALDGYCHSFCGPMTNGKRYCGEGDFYEAGDYISCTGCANASSSSTTSSSTPQIIPSVSSTTSDPPKTTSTSYPSKESTAASFTSPIPSASPSNSSSIATHKTSSIFFNAYFGAIMGTATVLCCGGLILLCYKKRIYARFYSFLRSLTASFFVASNATSPFFLSPQPNVESLKAHRSELLQRASELEEVLRNIEPDPARSDVSAHMLSVAMEVPLSDMSSDVYDSDVPAYHNPLGYNLHSKPFSLDTPDLQMTHQSFEAMRISSTNLSMISSRSPSPLYHESELSDDQTLGSSILPPEYRLHAVDMSSIPSRTVRVRDVVEDCAICQMPIEVGERRRTLICGHSAFHSTCIGPWLRDHTSCPLCRAQQPMYS